MLILIFIFAHQIGYKVFHCREFFVTASGFVFVCLALFCLPFWGPVPSLIWVMFGLVVPLLRLPGVGILGFRNSSTDIVKTLALWIAIWTLGSGWACGYKLGGFILRAE